MQSPTQHMLEKGKLHIYREKNIQQIHSFTHSHTHIPYTQHSCMEKLCYVLGKFLDLVLTTVEPAQVIFERRLTITTLDMFWY